MALNANSFTVIKYYLPLCRSRSFTVTHFGTNR